MIHKFQAIVVQPSSIARRKIKRLSLSLIEGLYLRLRSYINQLYQLNFYCYIAQIMQLNQLLAENDASKNQQQFISHGFEDPDKLHIKSTAYSFNLLASLALFHRVLYF